MEFPQHGDALAPHRFTMGVFATRTRVRPCLIGCEGSLLLPHHAGIHMGSTSFENKPRRVPNSLFKEFGMLLEGTAINEDSESPQSLKSYSQVVTGRFE